MNLKDNLKKYWPRLKKTLYLLAFIFVLLFVFSWGFWQGTKSGYRLHWPSPFEKILNREKPQELGSGDMSIFWQTWEKILTYYIDRDKLDAQKMIEGATQGLVDSLGDPYSEFLNATASKELDETLEGSFEGIGVEIGKRNGYLTVIAPLKNTPAERAGLKPGDRIIKINDQSTENLTLNEAVNLIRGPHGTKVKLSIYRPAENKVLEFTLSRDVIKTIACDWEPLDHQIAHLKIYYFGTNALNEFIKSAIEISRFQPKGLILDLRDNPGGYLEMAVELAGWFLEKGDVVVKEEGPQGEIIDTYRAKGNAYFANLPTVILINEGTASAAEILAAALRDNRQIQLIGENSFGKGSVQEVIPLDKEANLKITVARWLTPKGEKIEEKGLKPDVEVKNNPEEILGQYSAANLEKDLQLKKALEIINQLINQQ